jgi:hypothetical protein
LRLVDYGGITVAGAVLLGTSSLGLKSGVADSIISVTLVNGLGDIIIFK